MLETVLNDDKGLKSGPTELCAERSKQSVGTQPFSGSDVSGQIFKNSESHDATKSDHRHEISEDVLVPSKKREVREEENCHTDAPLPLELPKSRKTAPAPLDVNLQSEVAAGWLFSLSY